MNNWKDTVAKAAAEREAAQAEEDAAQAKVREAIKVRETAEQKRAAAEAKIAAARDEALVAILTPEVVEVLAPEHERARCSDADTRNESSGCARCALLNALSTRCMPSTPWRFTIEASS